MKLSNYSEQRKDRLGDIVADYMNDDEVTAEEFYQDILSEVKSWIDYHESYVKKHSALYLKLQGLCKEQSV
jgi:plasmid stabilization system protein ParE|tara:strand:+ start:473 stop:685 length:213 start_codon:yes stop_codon:yes gene_type:complete